MRSDDAFVLGLASGVALTWVAFSDYQLLDAQAALTRPLTLLEERDRPVIIEGEKPGEWLETRSCDAVEVRP